MTRNRRTATGWGVTFFNVGSSARSLTSLAYCAKHTVLERAAASTLPASQPTGVMSVDARSRPCTRKRPLVSGGFETTELVPGGAAPIVIQPTPSGAAWLTHAFNLSANPGTVSSYAYCF